MFNIQGSELIFLLLIALVVLGPEKLPDAVRKFGRTYAEFKKVANGFQGELRSVLDEPMRELRSTADALRSAANFDFDADAPDDGVADDGVADDGVAAEQEPAALERPQRAQRSESASPAGESVPRPSSSAKRAATLNFGNAASRAKRPQQAAAEESAAEESAE